MKKEVDLDRLLSARWLSNWLRIHEFWGGAMEGLGLVHAIAAAILTRSRGCGSFEAGYGTALAFPAPKKRPKRTDTPKTGGNLCERRPPWPSNTNGKGACP